MYNEVKKKLYKGQRGAQDKICDSAQCATKTTNRLLLCVPRRNLFTHFILRLTLLPTALCAIGSTLGAATGLFRAGGMSTLHSLSEWRLTTCGASPPPPPTLTIWPGPLGGMRPTRSNSLGSTQSAQMCDQNIPMLVHIWRHCDSFFGGGTSKSSPFSLLLL